jgi:endo-1,4-beta-xylanase
MVAALAAGALAWIGPSGATAGPGSPDHAQPVDQSLRSLAARHDLLVGTAVDMTAYNQDTPYRQRIATEFSAVTAENVMKWSELEPVRGQYNWGPADQLVEQARRNRQKVHGHTLRRTP